MLVEAGEVKSTVKGFLKATGALDEDFPLVAWAYGVAPLGPNEVFIGV